MAISLAYRGLRRMFSELCSGCGATFQHVEQDIEGFIPQVKLENLISHNLKVSQEISKNKEIRLKDLNTKLNQVEIDPAEAIPDMLVKEVPKLKPVVCSRWHGLSNYSKSTLQQFKIGDKSEDEVIDYIMEALEPRSLVFKLIDITDLNASICWKLLDKLQNKKVVLLVNKIDTLPKNVHIDRIYKLLRTYFPKNQFEDLVLLSSKAGDGISKVKSLMKNFDDRNYYYAAGRTNTGKSTFINALARATWDIPKSKFKKLELTDTLTTSELRGTTLGIVPIKLRSLGVKIRDTPGIPAPNSMNSHFSAAESCRLIHSKRIMPKIECLHNGKFLRLGNYAELSVVDGDYIFAGLFKPSDVRYTINSSSQNLFTSETITHDFTINSSTITKAEYDIEIFGLGWISIRSPHPVKIQITLPKDVGVVLREALMPFEGAPGFVKKNKVRKRKPFQKKPPRAARTVQNFA